MTEEEKQLKHNKHPNYYGLFKDKTYIIVGDEVYRKIPVKKMTKSEIEKELGYKIMIVEEC